MNKLLRSRANTPKPERGQDIPSVEMPECWKGFFKAKENDQHGVITDVRAPMVIYCTDVAKRD